MMESERISRISTLSAVGLAVTLCVGWGVTRLQAFNPQPDPPAFAMVGMTRDQLARFGLVCSAATIHGVAPGPCRGLLSWGDGGGNVLKQAPYELAPGQSTYLDLNPEDVSWGDGTRVELQPIIAPVSGRAHPAVQLISIGSGRSELFALPISPRTSLIQDPSSER